MLHMFVIVFKCFCKCFQTYVLNISFIFYILHLHVCKVDRRYTLDEHGTAGDEGDVRAHCRGTRSQAQARALRTSER
jgi:hypothetical protein